MKRIATLGLLALLCSGASQAADKDDPLYASYICQQLAIKQMKTLGSAKPGASPATRATDKRWAGMDEVWVATGSVGSQVRFGAASIQSDYACTVQKVQGRWKLIEMDWPHGHP